MTNVTDTQMADAVNMDLNTVAELSPEQLAALANGEAVEIVGSVQLEDEADLVGTERGNYEDRHPTDTLN